MSTSATVRYSVRRHSSLASMARARSRQRTTCVSAMGCVTSNCCHDDDPP
eukprot:CAMPEP_0185752880 /NCGR_PEP_ID=MMETSP1174-20130828/11642_1 /TAXON_ID=35687 /ORGANISM="Dictyocha speculum, Strain CCMP1381" /LENGTH=49 /DNA_ID= /DNA_START= /DNA_END= /DNA_ORIENTATION=